MLKILPYALVILCLAIIHVLGFYSVPIFDFFHHEAEGHLLATFSEISFLCILSFLVFYLSSRTIFPSFVVAIFFGIAARPLLASITNDMHLLGVIVAFGATLILFGGGLEVPLKNFKKLFWKITALSFIGIVVTAFLFSFLLFHLAQAMGMQISLPVIILLGAVLASTDPAAIIPVLKNLRFHNRDIKDIVISESAMTDVTGTLLTVVFLSLITGGVIFSSVSSSYVALFNQDTFFVLLKQIVYGVVFGGIGFLMLEGFIRFKRRHEREFEADSAFFVCIPIVVFTAALSFGGSGYLAAFIAGLLLMMTEHVKETEHFFNKTIDGFLKPTIFLLLGALVNIQDLANYAVIGILMACVFMFIIRPISVFLSIFPFMIAGSEKLTLREVLFISFVRETGAIPAVLLVTIVSMGIAGMQGLVPIGMWIILVTLIVQPPLTPWIAKKLSVAEEMVDESALQLGTTIAPTVVMGTRGNSFERRLPKVVDWAVKHGIPRLIVVVCLEDKYTDAYKVEIEKELHRVRDMTNGDLLLVGKHPIDITIVFRKGLLQENIKKISESESDITAIFVGRKVLDFCLEEVKMLRVPLFFME